MKRWPECPPLRSQVATGAAGAGTDELMSSAAVRIVHAADIHLDSPMRGLGALGNPDLAARLRRSSRHAFDALVGHCLEELPAALVIAGDLYDGDWKDYATGAYFAARMGDLADVGVRVVIVRGNHDADSVIRRAVTLPPNVHLLDADAPESVIFDDVGLAVHGQSFATRAVLANLAQRYPDPVPGLCNVGVLHTSVAGYVGHDPYAPCDVTDLTGRGYEYFALGHVHAREVLATGVSTVAFSGNLQGRHVGEAGPKGALSVRLRTEEEAELRFVPMDVARWEVVDVCVDGLADMDALLPAIRAALDRAVSAAEGRLLVVRLLVRGTTTFACEPERLDAEVRALAEQRGIGVNKVAVDLRPDVRRTELADDERQRLEAAIASADAGQLLARANLAAMLSELGHAYLRPAGLDLRNHETIAELLAEAANELQARAEGGLL